MNYLIPVTAFVILIASSWSWAWNKKLKKPTLGGWIIGIAGALALFFGWRDIQNNAQERTDILVSIQHEGLRILPSDFQVKLSAWAHGVALLKADVDYNPPDRVSLFMSIGEIKVTGNFIQQPKNEAEYKGSRSPIMFWNYHGAEIFVEGLDKIKYLEELAGKTIQIYIPKKAFGVPFMSKLSGIKAYISIKGRQFEIEQKETSSDYIEIPITKDQLGLK